MGTATNDQNYYESPELWGKDSYITLENIIDNILLTASDDSYFKKSDRFRASIHGKQGIKRLNYNIQSQNKAIRIQLSPSLIFPAPRFMTSWIRVSVVNRCDNLTVLAVNTDPLIHDYLQDHEWKLLYDNEGNVLRGHDVNHKVKSCCYQIQCPEYLGATTCPDNVTVSDCQDDTFKDSWVKYIQSEGYFEFSEDLEDELIVIEYKTASLEGLDDCDVLIRHELELAITRWIEWQLSLSRKNVSMVVKNDYYNQYKIEKNLAKALLGAKMTLEQIVKAKNTTAW